MSAKGKAAIRAALNKRWSAYYAKEAASAKKAAPAKKSGPAKKARNRKEERTQTEVITCRKSEARGKSEEGESGEGG